MVPAGMATFRAQWDITILKRDAGPGRMIPARWRGSGCLTAPCPISMTLGSRGRQLDPGGLWRYLRGCG